MKKNGLKNTLKGIGCILFSLFLVTCDVGLGSSVDTTAPNVSIANPTAGAVMSGTVSLGGDASDDGVIESVVVTLTRIDSMGSSSKSSGESIPSYTALLDTDAKKWSYSLPTIDENGNTLIEDGTYQITVNATDSSKKESYRQTTFTVDNTPPVIIFMSPELRSDSLNYNLQFEGKIYDLTTIQNDMTLYICDSNGVTLASKTATLTGSGEWKVTFNGKEDLFIDKEGESPKLTAGEYHYYLTATDAAGNTNTYFFHKADIYTESFSPDTLEVSEWAKFDKGNIEEESNRPGFIKVSGIELNKTEAQEWEESIRINIPALEDSPSFVFSPEQVASITFSNIGGETFLNEGDSIVGSVTPPAGVDAPFKNDTFKAYISRQEIDENNLGSLTPAVASITNIGTSRNFSISTGGRGGGTYYVYIEIQNTSGRKFTAKQSFKISLSTPKLTISNLPNLQEIISDYAFKIEGKALVSTGEYGCNLEYVLQKNDEAEGAAVPVTVNDSDGVWSLEIPDEDGTYTYTFTARSNGFNAQLSRTVVLDTTNPTAEIVSLSQNENGSKVTANGTANDSLSGLSKIEYCFVEADKTPTLADWKSISSGSLANWKLNIDSSQLAEKDFRLYIKVTDAAENTFTTSKDITIDKAAPVLLVTTNAGWKANEIKTMSGTTTDTHFKTLSVSFNGENPVAVTVAEDGSWSWTPAGSTEDGNYTVIFEAEDTTGRRTEVTTDFTLDRVGPDLKVMTLSNGEICTAGENENNVLSISGTASDSLAGLKSIQYKVNSDEYKSIVNVSQNWTLNIKDLPEGDNSLQVKAVDNTDNVTELPVINFKTDYKTPEVWFGTTSAEVSEINVSDDIILTGKIYDYANTDESNFKYSLSYTRGDGESRTVSTDEGFTWDKDGIDDNDPTYRWSWTLPKQDSEGNSNDGRYTFTLSATDIAGRTVTKTRTVCMDTTGPEINTVLSNGDSFQSITNNINVSCSDVLSGVDRILWKVGGEASSDDDAERVTNNSAVVNFGTEGSGKSLTFIAYDKSGNRSYKTYTGLTVDTAPPVLQDVFGTAPQYIKAGESFSLIAAAIGDSAVAATDGVLIDKIEVIAKKNNVAQTASGQEAGYWYKSNNINQSSVAASVFKSIPAFSGIAANDGTWMVTLAVYDKSAQKTEKTFNFTIDATPPVVHVDTPVSGSFITGSTVEIRGNIEESDIGTGVESVTLTISGKKDGNAASSEQSASVNVRNWSAVLPLDGWDEGTLSISASATDRAGNVSAASAAASYKIDQNKPVASPITIKVGENETSSSWLNGNFTASGRITDTLGLSKDNFSIVVKKDGTAQNGINAETTKVSDTEYTWSCAVTAGTSGSYEITVGAADNSGKQATSVTRTVQIDKDAPVLTINNVADGAVLSGDSYTIRGTALDMPAGTHAGITSLQYRIDSGDWQAMSIAESWTQSLQLGSGGLAEGDHTIEIRANDDAGNNATNVSRPFMVDLGNPTITMTEVPEASKYINAPLTLTGTVTDTNPLSTGADGSMTVTAFVNGSAVTGSGAASYNKTAGTWSFSLPADSDGLKTVKLVATDAAGKTSEVTETITVDKTAPTVTVTNPGSVSQGFTLRASAYDMGKGVAWVRYSLDNATWTDMTSGTAVITAEALGAEGAKSIYVKSSDGLNETAVSETTFYFDTAEPSLSVTASTSATYTNANYTFTLSASDANLKDVTVTARKDGTPLTQGWPKVFTAQSGATTIDKTVTLASTAGDGNYIFSITATDKAGKSSQSETKTIVLDTTAPVISVTSPQTASYITGSTVEIRGSLEEASSGSGINSVALTVSGKKNGVNSTSTPALSVSGNEWSLVLPLDGWDEGSLSVRATASDRAGNVSTTPATAAYKLDQNKPVASNITIKVGTIETESSWLKGDFTASGRVTDTLGLSKDNFTIEVKKDGTALNGISPVTTRVSDTEYTWSLAVDADTSGQYEIKVGATDLSGKYADYVTRSVQIDGEAPELTIGNVADGTVLSGDSFTIRGTAKDKPEGVHAGITRLQYKVDSGAWQDITIAENWIQSIQLGSGGLAEGNHTIEIRSNDGAGNNATNVSRSFMVDLGNPTVTVDAVTESDSCKLVEDNVYINAPLTLSGTVTDTNPLSTGANGSMTVKAYVNGSEITGSGAATYNKTAGTWSFSLPADSDGLKTVRIVATDAAGKTSEVTETITVDKTAPTVTVVNPGSVSQGFTLTASAYDMGKGVAWVKYSLDNITWTDLTSGSSWTKTFTTEELGAEGEKTIYVKASDGLNESKPVATSFYLDTADPVLTVTASPDANYTNGAYTLTINARDANLRQRRTETEGQSRRISPWISGRRG
ncbi:MAG: Ig-like domain repeat protein, partial [Treponemataceae bacterium]|nr:Ig-like domain repeat protein [Treponemataceae bacterium]